jgi:hypothetical protein
MAITKPNKGRGNGNKPTAAFILTLFGGILVLLAGILIAVVGAVATIFLAGIGGAIGLVGIISGIVMIISAVMMNSTNKSKVTTWSIIALVFSLISLANGGGFIIGFILGLVGGILGLTYKG